MKLLFPLSATTPHRGGRVQVGMRAATARRRPLAAPALALALALAPALQELLLLLLAALESAQVM